MVDRLNVPSRSIFIGDNLPVLRGINSDSVDLVYLDPPRNSGRTNIATVNGVAAGYEYDDTFTLEDMRSEWLEEIEVRQPDVLPVINAAKVTHGHGMAAYLTFMGVRLVELHRILKPGGSIYLHCNPGASHYLKALMDGLLGPEQFKSEITWKRQLISSGPKRWRWTHDTILFYAGPRKYLWNQVTQHHSPEYWERYYRKEDEWGLFQDLPLTKLGRRTDDRSDVWRGIDPDEIGRYWDVPTRSLRLMYPARTDIEQLSTAEKLDLLDEAGLVNWPASGSLPRYKIYAEMSEGERLSDVLTTIGPVIRQAREDAGWPDQVPEDLLHLIVRASTNPGDVVLDPFCGSGTACVVAEQLGRHWVGIEQAQEGFDALSTRLDRELDLVGITAQHDPPDRTDTDMMDVLPKPHELKSLLYGKQEGRCRSCEHQLPLHLLAVDRIDRRYSRRPEGIENLQLLCLHCKGLRGRSSPDYLVAELYRRGVLDSG